LFPAWDQNKDVNITFNLMKLVKIEDWFKNGDTIVKTLRKGGKGRSPYVDTTVKMRLKFQVNDKELFSNYKNYVAFEE